MSGPNSMYGEAVDKNNQHAMLTVSVEENGILDIILNQSADFSRRSSHFRVAPSGFISMRRSKGAVLGDKPETAKSITSEELAAGLMELFRKCQKSAEERQNYHRDKPYMQDMHAREFIKLTSIIANIVDFKLEPFLWRDKVFKQREGMVAR